MRSRTMLALILALAATTALATVTKTIKPTGQGGDYDNFQAAWNSIPSSLTEDYVFEVYTGTYATFDATGKTAGSWTITFKAAAGQSPRIYSAASADYGVYGSGQNNVKLIGLEIDCYASPVYLTSTCDGWRVENCRLSNGTYNGYVVYIYSGCDSDTVIGCTIDARGGSYGINYNNSSYGYYCYFANNFIYNWASYGINAYYHYYTKLYYNTVYSTSGSYALRDYYGYNGDYRNNILYSPSYAWYKSSGAIPDVSNYNCFKVHNQAPPYASLIYYTTNRSLATWQSTYSRDQQSVEVDPLVVSANDLHLRGTSTLKTAGTPITELPKDIDGDTRHVSTPSIGADEFVPGSALSGTKYIKVGVNKPAQDTFPSFNAALTAMIVYGVGGDLTFNVCAGTYNENLVIANPGNGTYKVTFQANEVFDAIDSVYLTTGVANAVQMTDVDYFRFRNIKVTGFTSYGFYLGYSANGSDANLIEGCRIAGPNGVYVDQACDDDSVVGCNIQCTSSYGVNLPSTGYRYRTVIANNMIRGWTSYGVYAYNHYNTVLSYNTIYSTGSYAFYNRYGYTMSQQDNIYVGASYAYYQYYGDGAPSVSNYNCFWLTGGGAVVINDNGSPYDLVGWRSARARDQQSVNIDPMLVSATDLHLTPWSPCVGIGTALTWPTIDIDADGRGSTVDIGADEYVPSGSPMSGDYTIDAGGSGDYLSFAAATADLISRGISGWVTFTVYAGTYNEWVNLSGLQAAYPVTFQAREQGGVIDQVNLGSATSYAIQLTNCKRFRFRNLNLRNFTSYGVNLAYSGTTGSDANLIEGCSIVGPSGIQMGNYCDDDSVVGCNIQVTSSYGIYLLGVSTSVRNLRTVIANNMVSGWTSNGIYLRYHEASELYYNTVYSASGSYAYDNYYGYNGATGQKTKNNIFVGPSYAYYQYYGDLPTTVNWNYNCYRLTGGGANTIYHTSFGGNTLAYWKTYSGTRDDNSIDQDPMLLSSINLHLRTGSPCIGTGTALGWPTTDIDGDGRGTTVDMGADEWTYPGDPMAGVYTIIPDGSGDFRSFAEARDAMWMRGFGGAVIFDVYAGTYNERVQLEGLGNGTNRVTFRAHQTTDGYDNVVVSSGLDYGIWLRDQDLVTLDHLVIQNYTSYGIYLQHIDSYNGCDKVVIRGCTITGPNGIYLHYGADDDTIVGNTITATSNYGIYLYGYSSYVSRRNVIVNNIVTGFTSRGVYLNYHDETKLYYNTVANLVAANRYPVDDQNGTFTESRNNILYQPTSGYYCYYKTGGNTLTSDYNCFYNNGTANIAYYDGAYTWATWRSSRGMDPHGINRNPTFRSIVVPVDLHLQDVSPCRDSATVLTGFVTDIDGEGRGSKPDIGADEVFVDLSVSGILVPTGLIQLGVPVTPQVHIKHLAGPAATIDLTLKVFKGASEVHSQTKTGVTLAIGEEKDVTLDNAWTPAEPGADYSVSCWHSATPDGVPANDTARSAVEVGTVDVAMVDVTWPTAVTELNTMDYPRVTLRNNGPFAANVSVSMTIDDEPPTDAGERGDAEVDGVVWSQTRAITVPAGEERTLSYSVLWTATPVGDYYAKAYHWLANDQDRTNDTTELLFDVLSGTKLDVGVLRIDQPPSYVDTNATVTGSATFKNYSAEPASFGTWFFIEDPTGTRVESWSVPITDLGPGEERTEVFGTHFVGTTEGQWAAVCSTWALNDTFADNDDMRKAFTVSAAPPFAAGWQEVANVPATPTAKQVKDGGWLAAATSPEDGGTYVYAAKGNKTGDFFKYNPVEGDSGTWYVLDSIPADEGGRAKLPKKGSAGVSDGTASIYATKGNNTLGFWKYDIENDSWGRMPDVPAGPDGKKVKGGNDLAYVYDGDTGWVYLMKGYRTEFYRFNTETKYWDTLPDVPYGIAPKYNVGSFLTYDQGQYLYAHQAKYTDAAKTKHFMFRYDLVSQAWDSATGMPVLGMDAGKMKNKKSKDGGSGVWDNGYLYALKGGNTVQFYRYEALGDSWTELDTMKSFGSTAKKKKVKAGGDLVGYGRGVFFALKGNKTYEFWRYVTPSGAQAQAQAQARSGVQAGISAQRSALSVAPNPLAGGSATVRYSLPKAGPVSVTVFDVAGRSVFATRSLGHSAAGTLPLDLRGLSAGVYLVRLDADGYSQSQKLVVQR